MSKLTHSTDEGMRKIDERRAREDGEAPDARHTEGPWHPMACDDGFWIGNDNENAAFVPGFTDHPLNQANASLVAAAPEMLAEHNNIGIGGNHLASVLIQMLGPDFASKYPPDLDADSALRMLCATTAYDVWCCWAAIMRARPVIDKAEGRTP